jgi:hypothetical protein
MVFWAAAAAAAIVFVIAVACWPRRGRDDALDYDDFVELGRAAWIDLRDTDVGNTDVGNTDVGNTDVGNTERTRLSG